MLCSRQVSFGRYRGMEVFCIICLYCISSLQVLTHPHLLPLSLLPLPCSSIMTENYYEYLPLPILDMLKKANLDMAKDELKYWWRAQASAGRDGQS